MKKFSYFIIGAAVGATVMTASSVFATEIKQLVGTKVGSVWELYVDGENIGDVPIINDSSYAPVRQVAEIAGMDVDFEHGKVFLESREEVMGVYDPTRIDVVEARLRVLDVLVQNETETIAAYEILITQEPSDKTEASSIYRGKVAEIEVRIAEYESELAELKAELTALEAEDSN